MRTESRAQPDSAAKPAGKRRGAPQKTVTTRPDWEEFLLGKKTKAARFLDKMRKAPEPVPAGEARTQLVAETISKKDGIERLLDLVQSSMGSVPSIRDAVLDLGAAGLEGAGVNLPPPHSNPHVYSHRVMMWLEGLRRPLKARELQTLLLLLHIGVARYSLDRESAFELLERALSPPKGKSRTQRASTTETRRVPEEILILADPAPRGLTTLLEYENAVSQQRRLLEIHVERQAAESSQLQQRLVEAEASLRDALEEIRRLRQEGERADSEVASLRQEIVDLHGGYKYKLYELRGRVRGVLGGQLTQWLRTALDASYASPPRTGAIQERLEDALSTIEKEMQWLRPSD